MFRVCRARTNEDRLLLSLLPIQHGTRRGHIPASSVLFQPHRTSLQTPLVSASSETDIIAKEFVTGWEDDHSPPRISLYLIMVLAHDKNSIGLYLCASLSALSG